MKTVTDKNGVLYELAGLIGHGGQGTVYAVKGGRLAVKIMERASQAQRDRLRTQLAHVRRLPLDDLALARPIEMLREPHTGYVMEMLTGMVPIKSLITSKEQRVPSSGWYLGSGGLQRRLLLLAKAAHVISQLHGKGIVFSDLSPTNIFVSRSQTASEVWLIDTDNLQYESNPGDGVFTLGYGAPELVRGASGVSTLSDVFALAVLAFQTLTLVHPFIGDMVSDGDAELEEQAFAGLLPWIDAPDDVRNRASFGVPREWVLSARMFEAFRKVFGPGRTDPCARPGSEEWADMLFSAADSTIVCPSCSGTSYFNSVSCPWCGQPRPAFVTAAFHLWDPSFGLKGGILTKPSEAAKRPVLVGHGAFSEGQTFFITRRLAFGHSNGPVYEPVVSMTFAGNRIKLRSVDGKVYHLSSPTGNQQSEIGDVETIVKLEDRQGSWRIHFGDNNSIHRVASLELRRGGSV